MDSEYGAMMAGEALERSYGAKAYDNRPKQASLVSLSSRLEVMQKLAYTLAEKAGHAENRIVGPIPESCENASLPEGHVLATVESILGVLDRANASLDRLNGAL